jgi:hypothetical protein
MPVVEERDPLTSLEVENYRWPVARASALPVSL